MQRSVCAPGAMHMCMEECPSVCTTTWEVQARAPQAAAECGEDRDGGEDRAGAWVGAVAKAGRGADGPCDAAMPVRDAGVRAESRAAISTSSSMMVWHSRDGVRSGTRCCRGAAGAGAELAAQRTSSRVTTASTWTRWQRRAASGVLYQTWDEVERPRERWRASLTIPPMW